MAIRGVFTSHAGLNGERQQDLSARVLWVGPGGMAPMLALSSGMPSEPAKQTSYSWIEDEHISGNQAVVTGGNSGVTTMVMDSVGIWTKNTVIMNQTTGEYILITALNADGVTVDSMIRGFGGTTAATITAADKFQSVGTAFAEGSDRPEAVTQKGDERTNYVQIFKNGWAITGTANAVTWVTGSQTARNRELCFAYHAEDIERATLWGRKGVRVVSGLQLRTSNGIIPQIEDYGGIVESVAAGGNAGEVNMVTIQNFMRRIFDKQAKGFPNERIAFSGSNFLELLQKMVLLDSTYNIESKETEYGITVTTIIGFNGRLKIISHPMMVENEQWQKELYVLHPGLIKKRVKRDSWSEEFNAQKQNNNGKDSIEGYLAIEQGWELRGAQTMGILRNLTTAVASF